MTTPICTIADVTTIGMPASALGVLTTGQQQGCVDAANGTAESYCSGRFPLPWTSWGPEVTFRAVMLARKFMLDVRGRNPSTANADKVIDDGAAAAEEWFKGVQRQSIHPNIVPAQTAGGTDQGPVCISSSAGWTNSSERTTNRGI